MTKDRSGSTDGSPRGFVVGRPVCRNGLIARRSFAGAVHALVLLSLAPSTPAVATGFVSGCPTQIEAGLQANALPLRRPCPGRPVLPANPSQPSNLPQPVIPPLPISPARPTPPGSTPSAPETIPPEVAQVLTAMAAQAAVIFVGQVRSVARQDAHGFVDISFAVQTDLRGTTATTYVLREWAGLWTWQQDRYRVGERLLLLLLPRSSSGFSSPVGGLDGALPLLGGVQPPLLTADGNVTPDTGASSPSSSNELANTRVDLRWIAALVVRPPVGGLDRLRTSASVAAVPWMPPETSPHPTPVPPLKTGSSTATDGTAQPGVALSAVLALLDAAPEAAMHDR